MLESFCSLRKFFSGYSNCIIYGELTADPPKDGSATIFKAEALRAQSKKVLIKEYFDLCELCVSAVK